MGGIGDALFGKDAEDIREEAGAAVYRPQKSAFQSPDSAAMKKDTSRRLGDVDLRSTSEYNKQAVQARENQGVNQLVQQLQQQAAGQGPSLAEQQLQRGGERSLAQAMALQQAARATPGGMAQRNIARQQAATSQGLAAEAATQKLQERQLAQSQLGSALGQQIQQGQFNTQLQQQTALANQQAQMQAQAQKDQMTQYYLNRGLTMAEADRAANMAYEQTLLNRSMDIEKLAQGREATSEGRSTGFFGGLAQGAMSAIGLSDEKEKKNVTPVSNTGESKSFVEGLKDFFKNTSNKDFSQQNNASQVGAQQAELGKSISSGLLGPGIEGLKSGLGSIFGGGVSGAATAAGPNLGLGSLAEGSSLALPAAAASGGPSLGLGSLAAGSSLAAPAAGAAAGGGGLLASLGPLAALSDKELKKEIEKTGHTTKDFLNALKAYTYEYKNPDMPGAGKGRHMGVMAQDLEKAGPIGKSMVKETPNGTKMVDYGQGFGAVLAAVADIHDRLKKLESKKKGK